MKRILIIVLSLALCLGFGMMPAAADNPNFNETGFPIVNETVTYTFFAPHNSAVEDYYTNTFVTMYEDMTNVHIEWDLVPQAGLDDKRALVLASNNLPDAFFGSGISVNLAVRYGDEGVFLAVEDLMDKYNPELQKMFVDMPAIKSLMFCPDGHIYQYPSVSQCYHCSYPHKFYINRQWIENLGLTMPTTTDELYDVLKAFKEGDPTGTGVDVIPMSAAQNSWSSWPVEWIMNAFIYDINNQHIIVEDGVVAFSPTDDRYKEGLKFLRKLFEEELLDNECFIMDMAMLESKMRSGDVATVGAAPCMHYLGLLGVEGERPYEYDSLPPISGPAGYKSSYWDPFGLDKGKFVITTDAKDPEILARWIDYFYTEEGLLSQKYGVENQEWFTPTGGEMGHGEGLEPAPSRFDWMPGKSWSETVQNVTLNQQGPIYETRAFRGAWTADLIGSPLEPNLIAHTKPYEGTELPEFYTDLIVLTLDEVEEFAPLKEQLDRYVNEMNAAFISGQVDIEDGWANYQQELINMGVERYVEIRQAAYERFLAAGGLGAATIEGSVD